MEGPVERIILLPRYTSFAGTGTFHTAPVNVRPYSRATVNYVETGALGSIGPEVDVRVEESADLEIWEEIGGNLNSGEPETREFRFEWIRLKLAVTGSDPGFTCWCVGDFVLREG
jgi:hypothetical protein